LSVVHGFIHNVPSRLCSIQTYHDAADLHSAFLRRDLLEVVLDSKCSIRFWSLVPSAHYLMKTVSGNLTIFRYSAACRIAPNFASFGGGGGGLSSNSHSSSMLFDFKVPGCKLIIKSLPVFRIGALLSLLQESYFLSPNVWRLFRRCARERSGFNEGIEAHMMPMLTSTMDHVLMGNESKKGSLLSVKMRRDCRRIIEARVLITPRPNMI
jgi:hypothetical protein